MGRRIDGDGNLCAASRQAPTGEAGASHRAPTEGNIAGVGRGYRHEAIRQTPTGEGAASRQAPKNEIETSVGPDIRCPQEKVQTCVRKPQNITVRRRSVESE